MYEGRGVVYIGLCFQVKDDIFDYYESKQIGKPTGNDMLEGKLTLPVLYALNSTHDERATLLARRVKAGQATADEIGELIAFTCLADDGRSPREGVGLAGRRACRRGEGSAYSVH